MHTNFVNTEERPFSISTPSSGGDNQTQPSSSNLRQTSFAGIISECPKMQRVFAIIDKVARTDATVLVLGESGTGKELVANAIHKLSGRKGKLVPVNCGAIPEEILESELFGHEKGSFTGATNTTVGRFQLADGGTIFLDEIGEMSPRLQVKLLRVLQDQHVEPVGSSKFVDVDVRVIAATNKNLFDEVKAGRFRQDLYYRLQVVPIELPALRIRDNDIAILSNFFVEKASQRFSKQNVTIAPAAMEKITQYSWPGNVRELENLIERMVILGESDVIDIRDLPSHICSNGEKFNIIEISDEMPPDGLDFNNLVNKFETHLISMALTKTNGNKKAAAKLLQLNRTTLVEKIKKKGLDNKVEVIVEKDSITSL